MKVVRPAFIVWILLFCAMSFAQEDSVNIDPPRIIGEIGLAEMPENMTFPRSDSGSLVYSWSIRIRIFREGNRSPDVFAQSIKYEEDPGQGSFKSNILAESKWVFERRGQEREFYQLGSLELIESDSSFLFTCEMNPTFLDSLDSVRVYGVTDYVAPAGYRLRDITNYGKLDQDLRDPVGDISDSKFDIKFIRVKIPWLEAQTCE